MANVLANQRPPHPPPTMNGFESMCPSPEGPLGILHRAVSRVGERGARSLPAPRLWASLPGLGMGQARRGQWALLPLSQCCRPESVRTREAQMVRGRILNLYLDRCSSESWSFPRLFWADPWLSPVLGALPGWTLGAGELRGVGHVGTRP